jgi:prefoldin beta subunit
LVNRESRCRRADSAGIFMPRLAPTDTAPPIAIFALPALNLASYHTLTNHDGGAATSAGSVRGPAEVPRWYDNSRTGVPNHAVTNKCSDLQGAVEARQKLEAQQSENQAVKKEFDGLDEEAGIYKLVGPILLKQERTEAVSAVDGRLEYIGKEITRTEDRIKELETAADNKRVELMQLQQKMQMAAQGQAAG